MHDLRIALRTLARSPGFTLVALITLVLGIGATTSVFSIVNGVLLSPLGFVQEDRLVRAAEVNGRGGIMDAAWRNFLDWREQAQSFEGLTAYSSGESTVLGAGEPLRPGVANVSEGFFRTLRAEPAVGRSFLPQEHVVGGEPVVVVSHSFWRTHLSADPDISRRTLIVAGYSARVVGVMPATFAYPAGTDIWYPLELDEPNSSRTSHNYQVLGRLKPGVTIAQAKAELDVITRRILESEPGAAQEQGFDSFFPRSASLISLREALVGNTQRPLWILLSAAMLVLLVACTNLASTTLARGTAREHEYAIRHALGAGRGRMIRALVAETAVLTAGGAVLGLLLAWFVLKLVPALAPAGVPRLDEVQLNARVAAFTVLLSIIAALLSGLLPGLRVSNNALRSLRSGARAVTPGKVTIWKTLIACEVALALLLLVGSGLLLRSFWTVLDIQPGFATKGVLTATVNPPSARFNNNETKRLYYDELLRRLDNMPGVQHAGVVMRPPLSWVPNGLIQVDDGPQPTLTADYQLASPGYFRALDIQLLRGRFFDNERETTEHVVVVNQALADQAWPGEDPIGKRITGGGMDDYWNQTRWATVIGVVNDMRQRDLTARPRPTLYFSYTQRPFRAWSMTAVLRPQAGQPATLIPAVREAIRAIDSDVPVEFATIEQSVATTLAPRRFILSVILAFAVVALVLAGVGVYGVVAYAVERRRKEIGVRLAIGAQPHGVRRMLQREYMTAAAAGALVGTILALAFTRVLASMLFEVKTTDPLTFATVIILLGAAAWIASLIPAWRSTRIDPLESMRSTN